MPFSLVPDRVFDCYADITPDYLAEQGITLLLSDLDFTLADAMWKDRTATRTPSDGNLH